MAIKIAYTEFGTIMGDFSENLSGSYVVDTPVIVNAGAQGFSLFPFLAITTSKTLTLSESAIHFGEVFDPQPEIRNYYSSQFGSGIVLGR